MLVVAKSFAWPIAVGVVADEFVEVTVADAGAAAGAAAGSGLGAGRTSPVLLFFAASRITAFASLYSSASSISTSNCLFNDASSSFSPSVK